MGALANSLRIEQSRQQIQTLQNEIGAWLATRRKLDKFQQHFTQFNALETALCVPLQAVRAELNNLDENARPGALYRESRVQDTRVVFIRRVWNYFREKFDQRDDPKYQGVLTAADEIVWSCYREVFENQPQLKQASAPLPYIDATYASEALVRDSPPSELTPDKSDQLLFQFLQKLPIPIVRLPVSCADAPWQMIFLGHEVGHHLQFDLAPQWGLVTTFGQWITDSVLTATNDADAATLWRRWSVEIFADTCGVCAMGAHSTRAMIDLLLLDDAGMLARNTGSGKWTYPSAIARLEFMARVGEQLGLKRDDALGELKPDAYTQGAPLLKGEMDLRVLAAADLKMMQALASKILDHIFNNLGTFKQWFGWSSAAGAGLSASYFAPQGDMQDWVNALTGNTALVAQPSLYAPRLIASASYRAYLDLAEQHAHDLNARAEKFVKLKNDVLQIIPCSREEGTRAADETTQPNLEALGDELTKVMLDTLHDLE